MKFATLLSAGAFLLPAFAAVEQEPVPIRSHLLSRRLPGDAPRAHEYLIGDRSSHESHLRGRQNGGNSTDPCAQLASGTSTVFTPGALLACLQSTPFSEEVRQSMMGAITALNTLNVFEYNQLGDASPDLNQGVNWQQELKRINSSTYSSDYDFQSDLLKLYNKLNDGHFYYQSCYSSNFVVQHGLPIVALSSGNNTNSTTTNVYLAPDLPLYVNSTGFTQIYAQFGINATRLAGLQVTKYDGQDIWQYLNGTLLSQVGQYQDPSQRLNSIFASYQAHSGNFGRNPGAFTSTTDLSKNNFTLTIKDTDGQEKDITVPWIAYFNGKGGFQYTSGTSLFENLCLAPSASGSGSGSSTGSGNSTTTATTSAPATTATGGQNTTSSTGSTGLPSFESLVAASYQSCPSLNNASSFPLQGSVNPTASGSYLGGRDVMFFVLPNSKTGVVYISTFGPADASGDTTSSPCRNRFVVDLLLGMQNFTKAGVESVLVDTTNNGGGSVQLNQLVQRLFTGAQYKEQSNFKNVFRSSDLSKALLGQAISTNQDGIWTPSSFRSGSTNLANNTNYFDPGQTRTINNQQLAISNDLQDSIDFIDLVTQTYNVSATPQFGPSNIVFVGNGLCGSACSSFTNFLIQYYNATAYINAARPDQSIEFQAFAAGQAIKASSIYQDAALMNFNSSLLPVPPLIADVGFALRASLLPNSSSGTFLQYRSYPAQKAFALTKDQYSDPVKQWQYVADQVFPSGTANRTVQGGSGGNANNGGSSNSGNQGSDAGRRIQGVQMYIVGWVLLVPAIMALV